MALFAALSYAVTQSSRGGGDITEEQEKLDVAVAEQCEASVNYAISRVKILNGCSSEQISYELVDGTNANGDAPLDESCHLFRPAGGGAVACGEFLESNVVTGQVTSIGDTDTIVLMAGGAYFRCASWNATNCVPEFSTDGANFFSGNQVCTSLDSDPTQRLCTAACGGGGGSGGLLDDGAVKPWYLSDGGELAPFNASCQLVGFSGDVFILQFNCGCWS